MQASEFTLQTSKQEIYLSNYGANFSNICGQKVNNVVLKAGNNFAVTSNGALYAHGATFTGGSIYCGSYTENGTTKYKFSVDTNGNMIAQSGTFYGDGEFSGELKGASGTFYGKLIAGEIFCGPVDENGYVTGNFVVDKDGNMIANSGTFSGSLNGASGTFNGKLIAGEIFCGPVDDKGYVTGNFVVDKDGNMTAHNGTFYGSGEFSGALKGASGTFYGSLIAGNIWCGPVDANGNVTGNFVVDEDGNMTARKGTFYGSLLAGDIWCGPVDAKGNIIGNFIVDKDGNMTANSGTLKGSLEAGGVLKVGTDNPDPKNLKTDGCIYTKPLSALTVGNTSVANRWYVGINVTIEKVWCKVGSVVNPGDDCTLTFVNGLLVGVNYS